MEEKRWAVDDHIRILAGPQWVRGAWEKWTSLYPSTCTLSSTSPVPQWFPAHALSVPFSFLSLAKVGRISGPSCMSAMRTRSQLHEAALRPESSMFRMQEESTRRDQHVHLFLWQAWNGTASGKWYEINQFLCLEETNGAPCHLRVHGAPTWCQSHSRRPHAPTALQVAAVNSAGVWCLLCSGDLYQGPPAPCITGRIDMWDRHTHSWPLSVSRVGTPREYTGGEVMLLEPPIVQRASSSSGR